MRALVVVGPGGTPSQLRRRVSGLVGKGYAVSLLDLEGRAFGRPELQGFSFEMVQPEENRRISDLRQLLRERLAGALEIESNLAYAKISELNFADNYWETWLRSQLIANAIEGFGSHDRLVLFGCSGLLGLQIRLRLERNSRLNISLLAQTAVLGATMLTFSLARFFKNLVSDFFELLCRPGPKSRLKLDAVPDDETFVWQSISGGLRINGSTLAP